MVQPGKNRLLKTPLILAGAAVALGILIYFFANFREERAVQKCFEALQQGDLEAAYQIWGPTEQYTFKDFLQGLGRRRILRKGPLLQDRRIGVPGQRRDREGSDQQSCQTHRLLGRTRGPQHRLFAHGSLARPRLSPASREKQGIHEGTQEL